MITIILVGIYRSTFGLLKGSLLFYQLEPAHVFTFYAIPVAFEVIVLVLLVRRFRIKRNASWGKTGAIVVTTDIAFYFIWLLYMATLVYFGHWTDGF